MLPPENKKSNPLPILVQVKLVSFNNPGPLSVDFADSFAVLRRRRQRGMIGRVEGNPLEQALIG